MADTPAPGSRHTYRAEQGLGHQARIGDPDLDDRMPAEMAALDLQPGTTVAVSGVDDERGLILLEWTDRNGTPRVTSVEPATFAAQFGAEES